MTKPSKFSSLLPVFLLFLLLLGMGALITSIIQKEQKDKVHEKVQPPQVTSRHKRDLQQLINQQSAGNNKGEDDYGEDDWENQKMHRIHIQMTNMEEEQQQEQETDRQVKQALIEMMGKKHTKNNLTPREQRKSNKVPGVDFRREFATDESNPYIENLNNNCEAP